MTRHAQLKIIGTPWLTLRPPRLKGDGYNKVRQASAFVDERIGRVYSSMALNTKAAPSACADSWSEAKNWYQRSLEVWQKLHDEGLLNAEDAGKINEVSNEIAVCDGEISNS